MFKMPKIKLELSKHGDFFKVFVNRKLKGRIEHFCDLGYCFIDRNCGDISLGFETIEEIEAFIETAEMNAAACWARLQR